MSINKNELYRGVTSKICGNLDFKDALCKTDEYLRPFFPLLGLTIILINDDFETLEIIATTFPDLNLKTSTVVPLTRSSREILKKGVFGGKKKSDIIRVNTHGSDSVLHEDVISELSKQDMFSTTHAKSVIKSLKRQSMIVLRLDISNTTIGYLSMNAKGFDTYTNEHTQLLKTLAEPFAIALSNYLSYRKIVQLKDNLADNQKNLQKDLIRISGDKVIGADNGLKSVMEQAKMVAGIDSPILILGETGVGKEVVANAIHQISDRRDGPMISVNCGAIPETLADSELFGHEKGAFTGASNRKRGYFERAEGGTIFLDEIGELSPSSQVKLLRFIQTRTFDRVGGTQPVTVDIRIIAATHRNLENMIEEGSFRRDLWFRLNVFPIKIPPLRERKIDIPALVEYLIMRKSHEMNLKRKPTITKGTIDSLSQYNWPGNVRELQNIVERALIICRDKPVSFDLPNQNPVEDPRELLPISGKFLNPRLEDILPLNETIKNAIEIALKTTHGRIEGRFGAATLLGLPPSTLKNKMKKLGISRLGNFVIN